MKRVVKPKRNRAGKYEKKLKVNASFDEILALMATKPPTKEKIQKRGKRQ